jgi:hypothetical protein
MVKKRTVNRSTGKTKSVSSKRKKRVKKKSPEEELQRQFVKYLRKKLMKHGAVITANGVFENQRQGGYAMANGYHRGYPDLHIDIARGGYFGYKAEMKWGSNTTSKYQKTTIRQLRKDGYYCNPKGLYTLDDAKKDFNSYYILPPTPFHINK